MVLVLLASMPMSALMPIDSYGKWKINNETRRVQAECDCNDASGNGFHISHNIVDNFHTISIKIFFPP